MPGIPGQHRLCVPLAQQLHHSRRNLFRRFGDEDAAEVLELGGELTGQ
jgi:hypothetical protein